MGKKKDVVRYKCMNFGVCAKADANEVIEFPSMDVLGGTPPCPCCKQNTLEEIGGTGPGTSGGVKIAAIAIGALVVLGGGGFGIYKAVSPSHPKEVSLNHYEKTLYVGDKDTLRATLSPVKSEGTLEWKATSDGVLNVDDGIVTAQKEGEGKIRVSVKDVEGIEAICVYTVKEKQDEKPIDVLGPDEVDSIIDGKAEPTTKPTHVRPVEYPTNNTKPAVQKPKTSKPVQKPATSKASGGINLGYGVYRGETLNGKPHGHGTITFKKTHRLISSKDYIAEPGDKYEGEFRNGQISGGMGYLYHDGDIIGVKP